MYEVPENKRFQRIAGHAGGSRCRNRANRFSVLFPEFLPWTLGTFLPAKYYENCRWSRQKSAGIAETVVPARRPTFAPRCVVLPGLDCEPTGAFGGDTGQRIAKKRKSPTAFFCTRTPPGQIVVFSFYSAFFIPGMPGKALMAAISASCATWV